MQGGSLAINVGINLSETDCNSESIPTIYSVVAIVSTLGGSAVICP